MTWSGASRGMAMLGVVVPLFASAAPRLLQQTEHESPGTQSQSILAFPAPGSAGSLVTIGINQSTLTLPVVTDNYGDLYQVAIGPVLGHGYLAPPCCAGVILYAEGIDGGTDPLTVTVDYPSSVTYQGLVAAEYAGIRTSHSLDSTTSDGGTTSVLLTTGALETQVDGELLFVAGVTRGNVIDAGDGFRQLSTLGNDLWADSIAGVAGSYSETAEADWTDGWMVEMAAFLPALPGVDAGTALVTPPAVSPPQVSPTAPLRDDYRVGWGCTAAPAGAMSSLLVGAWAWRGRRRRARNGCGR